ncbi:unnamed protein product [Durusdinium trenchii]|uniref:TFIIS N-terminal domain-containing protein n=1 Tax=Durusdinium trenchii TaxID=1381693 RepID=A0ABP0RNT9_9DINO
MGDGGERSLHRLNPTFSGLKGLWMQTLGLELESISPPGTIKLIDKLSDCLASKRYGRMSHSELDQILTETRHEAVLKTLEAWRKDPGKPKEGVQQLERMALGGPTPQHFDPTAHPAGSGAKHRGKASSAVLRALNEFSPQRRSELLHLSRPKPSGDKSTELVDAGE